MTGIGAPIKIIKVPEPRPDEAPIVLPSRRREQERPIPAPDIFIRKPAERPMPVPQEAP